MLQGLLLLWSAQALEHRPVVWHVGPPAPWHVGSSQIGIEPTSSALQGGFYTTDPPGKQQGLVFNLSICSFILPTHLCLSFPATRLSVHPLPTFPSTICLVSIYSSTHPILTKAIGMCQNQRALESKRGLRLCAYCQGHIT